MDHMIVHFEVLTVLTHLLATRFDHFEIKILPKMRSRIDFNKKIINTEFIKVFCQNIFLASSIGSILTSK